MFVPRGHDIYTFSIQAGRLLPLPHVALVEHYIAYVEIVVLLAPGGCNEFGSYDPRNTSKICFNFVTGKFLTWGFIFEMFSSLGLPGAFLVPYNPRGFQIPCGGRRKGRFDLQQGHRHIIACRGGVIEARAQYRAKL